MTRAPDAVTHRLAADEVRALERPKLLEDTGPTGAESLGELVGRTRPIDTEAQEKSRRRFDGPLPTPWSISRGTRS